MRITATNVFDLFARISLDSSGYEKGLSSAKSLFSDTGDKIKSVAGTISSAAQTAFSVAGNALKSFAGDAIQTGMSFDSAMSQVAATMGVTKEDISQLRDFAQEMGNTTMFSATQAAQALNYMALAGYDAEQSIATLPKVLDLAAAGGMDLARASDMVTDTQTALGLSIDETESLVDKMARTASRTNTSVSQLGDALLTVGATARSIKGGTTEISAVLGVLADNGKKGAEAGTALRNIIMALSNPKDKAVPLLEQLGVSTADDQGNLRSIIDIMTELSEATKGMGTANRASLLGEIFNKYDIAAVESLLGTTQERWTSVISEIENSAGASSQMAVTQMDNLAGSMTYLSSAAEGLKIAVSDKLSPKLNEFVKGITKTVSTLTSNLNGSDSITDWIFKITPDLTVKAGEFIVHVLAAINRALDTDSGENGSLLDIIIENAQKTLPSIKYFSKKILNKLIEGFNENVSSLDFSNVGEKIQNKFSQVVDFAKWLLDSIDFKTLGNKIADAMNSVDWSEVTKKIFGLIGEVISSGGDVLKGFAENIEWDNLIDLICLAFAPKLLPKLIGAIGAEFSSTAVGTALVGLGEYVVPALAAAMGGWMLGTAIRGWIENEFGEGTIDSVIEPVFKAIDKAFGTHFAKSDEEFMAEQEIDDKTYYEKALFNDPSAYKVRKFMEASDFSVGDMQRYIIDKANYGTDTETINEMTQALYDYMKSDKTIRIELNNGTIVAEDVNDFANQISDAVNKNFNQTGTRQSRMSGGRGY